MLDKTHVRPRVKRRQLKFVERPIGWIGHTYKTRRQRRTGVVEGVGTACGGGHAVATERGRLSFFVRQCPDVESIAWERFRLIRQAFERPLIEKTPETPAAKLRLAERKAAQMIASASGASASSNRALAHDSSGVVLGPIARFKRRWNEVERLKRFWRQFSSTEA